MLANYYNKIVNSDLYKSFKEKGYHIELKNSGHHWIITNKSRSIDFWPKKQKWKMRPNGAIGSGIENALKAMVTTNRNWIKQNSTVAVKRSW